MKPREGFGPSGDGGKLIRRLGWREVSQHVRFTQMRLTAYCQFHCEKPFMNNMPQAIHNPRPVKVNPRRLLVLKGIEAGPFAEHLCRLDMYVPSDRLKERVPWGDPFQVVSLGYITIRRTTRVLVHQCWELPIRTTFIMSEH